MRLALAGVILLTGFIGGILLSNAASRPVIMTPRRKRHGGI